MRIWNIDSKEFEDHNRCDQILQDDCLIKHIDLLSNGRIVNRSESFCADTDWKTVCSRSLKIWH